MSVTTSASYSGGATSSVTHTVTAVEATSGGTIVVSVSNYTAAAPRVVASVTDTAGNVYVTAGSPHIIDSSPGRCEVWYAPYTAAEVDNDITVHFDGAAEYVTLAAVSYDQALSYDASAASAPVSTLGRTHATPDVTTTEAACLVIGCFTSWAGSPSYTVASLGVMRALQVGYACGFMDIDAPTVGAYHTECTSNDDVSYALWSRSFKAYVAPPPPPPPPGPRVWWLRH